MQINCHLNYHLNIGTMVALKLSCNCISFIADIMCITLVNVKS